MSTSMAAASPPPPLPVIAPSPVPSLDRTEEEEEEEAELASLATNEAKADEADAPAAVEGLVCLEFETGNPTVELITGRLFLTDHPLSMHEDEEDATAAANEEDQLAHSFESADTAAEGATASPPVNRISTNLVYIYDIPAHLTLNELHAFLLDAQQLVHLQLIRLPSRKSTSNPTYAALLHFRTPADATAFVDEYDDVPFNSLEPEVCRTGFVARVLFDDDKYAFPCAPTSRGPATGTSTPIPHLALGKAHSREALSPSVHGASTPLMHAASAGSLLLPPSAMALTPSHTPALSGGGDPSSTCPSCPVCLESIHSSSSAMLTILCNHEFHFSCLAQWIPSSSSSSCPVCRYMMLPNVNTQCSTCKATDKLWLCILCGHVGCSRYSQGHAHRHYQQTSHNYAIEVLTQRVWDYSADCYVHRLVRNKTDGKLVELSRVRALDDGVMSEHCTPAKLLDGTTMPHESASAAAAATPAVVAGPITSGAHPLLRSPMMIQPSSSAYASVKLEEFLLEYNYLLSSQLDQQRRIFQQSLKQRETEMLERRVRLEQAIEKRTAQKAALQTKVAKAHTLHAEATASLAHYQSSHASLVSQSSQLAALHARLIDSHTSVCAALATSSKLYTAQQEAILREQEANIASLNEQIHDLQFYLSTQKKIDRMDQFSRRGGTNIGLKQKLQSGKAELQFVEVAPEEEEHKGKRRQKARR